MVGKKRGGARKPHVPSTANKKTQKRPSGIYEAIKDNKEIIALALILLLAVFLMGLFYSGIYWQFDDANYVLFIQQINSHTFNPGLNSYAYGWLFPYFVFFGGLVFGFTYTGLVIPTAIEYLSLIVLTYILCTRATKQKSVAIIAALMVCIFPFVVQYSTRLLDDMLLGVIATLSMIFFLSNDKKAWVLAGIMAGLLIYIKLLGLAYILPFLICALISKKRKYVVVSMIVTMALYTLPFAFLFHNPLYPFQNYGNIQTEISPATLQSNTVVLLLMTGLIQVRGTAPVFYQDYSLGLLMLFVFMGTVTAINNKNKSMFYVAVLFWGFLLYLFFGTISISHYVLAAVILRYFILVAAPMAILASYSIVSIATYVQTKLNSGNWLGAVVVVFLLFLILLSLVQAYVLVFLYNTLIRNTPRMVSWLGRSR